MSKEKKENPVYILDPFVEWAHKTGRIFMVCFIVYSIVIPIVISAVFKAWPSLPAILPALLNSDMIIGMMGTQTGTSVSVGGYIGLKQFLYQMGGEVFNDGGYSVALDENVALDAFELYTEETKTAMIS